MTIAQAVVASVIVMALAIWRVRADHKLERILTAIHRDLMRGSK